MSSATRAWPAPAPATGTTCSAIFDPTARRFQAVVISFENLEDEDSFADQADDPRSLHYVIGRLRLADAWTSP